VRWSQAELDQLQSLWTQAYKRAEYLPNGTTSDIFVFPKKMGRGRIIHTDQYYRSGTLQQHTNVPGGEVYNCPGTPKSQGGIYVSYDS
jgi:hypothetical protein